MYTIKNDAEVVIRHAQITEAAEARKRFCLHLSEHLPENKKIIIQFEFYKRGCKINVL